MDLKARAKQLKTDIPAFVPILGYLDDVLLLPLLVALTIKFIPKEIFEEKRKEAINLWKDGAPKKWYYALPIIFIWLLVIFLIVKSKIN